MAGIVKLDDLGLYLSEKPGEHLLRKLQRSIGRGIVRAAPWMMKTLSVIGTAAMFIVGGGILTHGIPGRTTASNSLPAKSAPGLRSVACCKH